MELNEVLSGIEDEKLKGAVREMAQSGSVEGIDVDTQKALVDALRKAKAADLLDLLKKQTKFKAVRKAARKALDGLRAFGIVPNAPDKPKEKRVSDLLNGANTVAMQVMDKLGYANLVFNIPEKAGVGPELLMVTMNGHEIEEVSRFDSATSNIRRLQEYLSSTSTHHPLVDLPYEQAAAFVFGAIKGSWTNRKDYSVEDAAHLVALFEDVQAETGLVEFCAQELADAQLAKDGDFEFIVPDPFVRGKMHQVVKEAFEMVTATDETQKKDVAKQGVMKELNAWVQDKTQRLIPYFTLAAYADHKSGHTAAGIMLDAAKALQAEQSVELSGIAAFAKFVDHYVDQRFESLEREAAEKKEDEDASEDSE